MKMVVNQEEREYKCDFLMYIDFMDPATIFGQIFLSVLILP